MAEGRALHLCVWCVYFLMFCVCTCFPTTRGKGAFAGLFVFQVGLLLISA